MFSYFVKNRHGYVTVMLIAMLISVLFFNTSFLEIARYRALEKLYGEIQENAAFSILANYDRDLFSKYGLLAVEDDVDANKLVEYILADINGDAGDGNKADTFFGGSAVQADLQKLYFLSQQDVFENQINEFCAYRAPISVINNGMNLEETLNQLISDLEDSLSALESFNQFADAADKTLDACQGMIDFVKDLEDTYFPAVETLVEAINSFNEAVHRREELKARIESQKRANEEAMENGNGDAVVDISGMENELTGIYTEIENLAGAVQGAIGTMKDAVDHYQEIHEQFSEAFDAMIEAEQSWSLDGAKADEDTGDMAQAMENTYEESKEKTQQEMNRIEKYDDTFLTDVKGQMEQTEMELNNVDGESVEELSVDSTNPYNVLMDGNLKEASDQMKNHIEEAEKELDDKNDDDEDGSISLNDIVKVTKLLVEITLCGGRYNIDCQEELGIDILNFTDSPNPYDSADKNYVDSLIQDVESTLDIEVDTNKPYKENQTYSALETALENLSDKSSKLQKVFGSFEIKNTELKALIAQLKDVIGSVAAFFGAAISAINALIQYATEGLMKLIYKKVYAATYATEMFTNRSSSLEDDKRMNGTEYTDYGEDTNHEVFYMANAEYVYHGSDSERKNQEAAFTAIYGLRIFANIPAILTDTTLHEVSAEIAAIPLVGPVLAIVLYVLIITAEAYLDMIFMIYGENGVSIIKTTGYLNFSGKGIDDLIEQVEGMIEQLQLEGGGESESGSKIEATKSLKDKMKGSLEDAGDNLTKWNYKEHLFVVLCLFKPSDDMYQNEARLIQMQLDKDKDEDFRLSNMATFVRTDTTVSYKPMLPVPYYGDGISIHKLYYTGY
ncbi:MAG: DUF5702 domain-containing protein [Lachnospiraceae bacterium]|nr:DUF5702 domain-containing protein [Lachnospiraceae bacterium]